MKFEIKDYLINIIYAISTLESTELAEILEDKKKYKKIFMKKISNKQKDIIRKRIQEEYAKFKKEYKKSTEDLYYQCYVGACLEYKTCTYVLFQIVDFETNNLTEIKELLEETLKQYKELFKGLVIITDNKINKLSAELLSWTLFRKMKEMKLITEHKFELLINRKKDSFKWGNRNEKQKKKNKKTNKKLQVL